MKNAAKHDFPYDVDLVAKFLDVTPETVRRWIRQGDLKAEKTSRKGGYRIKEKSLREFVAKTPKYHALAEFFELSDAPAGTGIATKQDVGGWHSAWNDIMERHYQSVQAAMTATHKAMMDMASQFNSIICLNSSDESESPEEEEYPYLEHREQSPFDERSSIQYRAILAGHPYRSDNELRQLLNRRIERWRKHIKDRNSLIESLNNEIDDIERLIDAANHIIDELQNSTKNKNRSN